MLQKETLLMTQAQVSESDTVTTQGFYRSPGDFVMVWSENINVDTYKKEAGKLGITGFVFGLDVVLAYFSPSTTEISGSTGISINALRINSGVWIEDPRVAINALHEVAGDNEPGDPVRVEVRF